ncbi:MAG: glycine zipper 2TM domain-containing protein [Desulfobacterales bacterium]|nr:glycine zipper 2TM domain-containing protein [Desulfobacterales bacterium]
MSYLKTVVTLLLCLALAGCASSRSGQVYTRDQARVTHTIERGTVIQVEPVQIEGTKSQVGTIAGVAVGGVLGSTIGQGRGRDVATVLGAVGGGLAGAAAEEELTKKAGLEITVSLDNGQTIVVVQEADLLFHVNDRVRVIKGSDGTTRVRY